MRAILLNAALLLPAAAPPAAAESGRTAAAFLQRPLGARAAGMGGAFAAVRGGAESMQYNPAALGMAAGPSLTSTYLYGFGGSNYGFLGYAHPTRLGTFAAGALYYNAGYIDLNLSDGTRGTVSAEENTAWTLSYAARPLPGLAVGGTFRHLRLELAESARASSSQADLGALLRTPLKGLTLGGAYQYIGPDIRFESEGDPPPRTLRYGLAFHFPEVEARALDPGVDLQAFDMTLAADVVHTLREEASPRFGLELGLTPALMTRVALRGGWVLNRDAESFAVGAGFEQGRVVLDYSISSTRALGHLQQVTLGMRFGPKVPGPAAP